MIIVVGLLVMVVVGVVCGLYLYVLVIGVMLLFLLMLGLLSWFLEWIVGESED